jgi:signal peptidase I
MNRQKQARPQAGGRAAPPRSGGRQKTAGRGRYDDAPPHGFFEDAPAEKKAKKRASAEKARPRKVAYDLPFEDEYSPRPMRAAAKSPAVRGKKADLQGQPPHKSASGAKARPAPGAARRKSAPARDYESAPRAARAGAAPRRAAYKSGPPRSKARRKVSKKNDGTRGFLSAVIAVIVALILGFGVKTFGFEMIRISGDAMSGALDEGQIVMVEKSVYYRSAPARGDVVCVKVPDGWIVRRIIALPGENIEIKGGVTYVNGEPLGEPYAFGQQTDYPPTTLSSGRYFVMSDNRANLDDSRTLGAENITRNRIKGKVSRVLWPPDQWKNLEA